MHATARLLLLIVLSSACNRSEEPVSSRGAQSASSPLPPAAANQAPSAQEPLTVTATPPTAATAPSAGAGAAAPAVPAASASAEPPCVVPLADAAPTPAKPAEHCPKDTGSAPKLERRSLRFAEAPALKLTVEMARSPAEHERGLMFRTKMPENQGMLFEWPSEGRRVFWMRNTCIPLDMLFIAKDGTVAGIQEQVPTLNEAPRTVSCPAAYVLEVNAGWCRRHGVKPGMHMKIE